MKKIFSSVMPLLTATSLLFIMAPLSAEIIVSDSFESGDMSSPGYNGFSWARNNRTSIVTMDPGPKSIWHNGVRDIDGEDWKDWTAYNGDNSLRFRYPPGVNLSEQRFNMSNSHPELWMSFWVRIPDNFNLIGGQTKFFSIWTDGYSQHGEGSTVWMDYNKDGVMRVTHSAGGYTVSKAYEKPVQVFHPIDDRGRWMQITVRLVVESFENASDGIMQVWHRWDGESEYTMTHEALDWALKVPSGDINGWSAGYLMGWVNTPYTEDTEWLIDDFLLSTSSLIGAKPKPPLNPVIVNQ